MHKDAASIDLHGAADEHTALKLECESILAPSENASRDLTADEQSQLDVRFARMRVLESGIAEHQRFARLTLPGESQPSATPAAASTTPQAFSAISSTRVMRVTATRAETRHAFNEWASTGNVRASFADELAASNNSANIPAVVGEVVATPRPANVFRVAMMLTGTEPIKTRSSLTLGLPLIENFAGGPLAQDAVVDGETDYPFDPDDALELQTKPYHSGIALLAITALLSAPDTFDLAGYLQSDLGYVKELGLENDIIDSIVADAAVTQGVTTASPTGITYTELVALSRQLPDIYDRLKVIFLSRDAFEAAEDLADAGDHPMLKRDTDYPEDVLRINGVPALKTHSLQSLAASHVVGIVVSMVGFRLRDIVPQKVIRYADWPKAPDQIGFDVVGYHAFDYAPTAVAKLKTPAA